MNISREFKAILSLMVLAGLIGQPVVAQDNGWYLGLNWGLSKATIDEDRISDTLLDSGLTTTSFDRDETSHGHKVYGGYQFNRNFAAELSYFNLGEFGFSTTTAPLGQLDGTLEAQGVAFDLLGLIPLGDNFSLFARVGVNHAEVKDTFTGSGSVLVLAPRTEESETNFKGGLGAQLAFNDNLALRVEAERYRIDDAVGNDGDIDMLSLGLQLRLGAGFSNRTAYVAPAVVPARAPAPTIVVAPTPVAQTEEYCSILDLHFDINNDDIQTADAEKLLVLATFLKKYPSTTALIEGHTDNIGSDNANLLLSRRRAESVVNYLVQTHGIAASRLTSVGHGASRPLADNSTEEGKRMNRRTGAVIACANDIEGLESLPERMTMALQMEFDRDGAVVRPQYQQSLSRVADFLKANPTMTATIEGHSDNSTPANSMSVSNMRAQNVANYLVTNFGIDRSRLNTEGFGQTRRFAYNTSQEGRQENRRVNIIFEYPPRQ